MSFRCEPLHALRHCERSAFSPVTKSSCPPKADQDRKVKRKEKIKNKKDRLNQINLELRTQNSELKTSYIFESILKSSSQQ